MAWCLIKCTDMYTFITHHLALDYHTLLSLYEWQHSVVKILHVHVVDFIRMV